LPAPRASVVGSSLGAVPGEKLDEIALAREGAVLVRVRERTVIVQLVESAAVPERRRFKVAASAKQANGLHREISF
jgi:hypothetical protein